jgi:prepilin-type N-terminal cleavage/methylation domain-containing protein
MHEMKRSSTAGVTLVELMISIAVVGLLVTVVGTFLIGGIKFYRLSSAKAEIQRDVRQCIDLINRNMRQGKASTAMISRLDASHPPCSLVRFQHINESWYQFYQRNNRFCMGIATAEAGPYREHVVAENIRSLFFTYPETDSDSIISVSLCFEKATYQGSSKTLQLSVEKIRIMNE